MRHMVRTRILTGELGCAYIRGLQGPDPDHPKAAACAKHFAVHSGPEAIRHEFDARVSKHDLYDTYLYAFKRCVRDAKSRQSWARITVSTVNRHAEARHC